eukprot:m.340228 g.340228  ORF g.340228 m.340228 type:complete len:614 (-) comp19185_c0_seq1:160-2001(-)
MEVEYKVREAPSSFKRKSPTDMMLEDSFVSGADFDFEPKDRPYTAGGQRGSKMSRILRRQSAVATERRQSMAFEAGMYSSKPGRRTSLVGKMKNKMRRMSMLPAIGDYHHGPAVLGDRTNRRNSKKDMQKKQKTGEENFSSPPHKQTFPRSKAGQHTPKPERLLREQQRFYGPAKRYDSPNRDTFHECASKAVLEKLDLREAKRQEAIFELTRSEAQYTKTLVDLLRLFQDPLRKNIDTFGVTESSLTKIFNNIDDIRCRHAGCIRNDHCRPEISSKPCHKCEPSMPPGLTSRMETARGKANEDGICELTNVGLIMKEWLLEGGLKPYAKYCAGIATAKHTLNTVLEHQRAQRNHFFDCFIQTLEGLRESRRQQLGDLLDLPRRRLQRYPLLLLAILKYTTESDPDYENLTTAIRLAEEACQQVNKEVSRTDGARIVAIQNSFEFSHASVWQMFNLVEDDEDLLLETSAKVVKEGKPCRLYLFSHVLILGKDSKHVPGKQQVMGRPIRLQNLEIIPGEELIAKQLVKPGVMDDVNPATVLHIRNADPSLQKGTKFSVSRGHGDGGIMQRGSGGSGKGGKAYVIQFMSSQERDEWNQALEGKKRERIAHPTSFV